MNDADLLFKALADPNRRKLLDLLYARDAQTLGDLCSHLDMTRQAATQHLGVLEAANLIATKWQGREKLHFLNPVPLQEIYQRWISKFERPRLDALHDLKRQLEANAMARSTFVYVTFIRTTPERLWSALTTPEFMKRYWFGMHIETDWKSGAPWRLLFDDGRVADAGEVVEIDPPKRLVLKWRNEWKPEFAAEGAAQCAIELEPADGAVKLTITHAMDRPDSKFIEAVAGGWPRILSNLKSLLETGEIAVAGDCGQQKSSS